MLHRRLHQIVLGLMLLAGCAFVLVPERARAQGNRAPEPSNAVLTTKDNQAVHITYWAAPRGDLQQESPVVVLLHMKGGNRFVWSGEDGLATELQRQGFAVISVDLRGHGESVAGGAGLPAGNANQDPKRGGKKGGRDVELKPVDYARMVDADMEAVKRFIYEKNQAKELNMNRMGIVGAELGANVAASYAVLDWMKAPHDDGPVGSQTPKGQDVQALVLISPHVSFPGMSISKSLMTLREPRWNISFMFASAEDDRAAKTAVERLFTTVKQMDKDGERTVSMEYKGRLLGTDMLRKRLQLEDNIVFFLKERLQKLPNHPWRDRQSKREKARQNPSK
jgi:pimeloyl-ACP methyl ester carboxylesterase